jgi:hypothetical protein
MPVPSPVWGTGPGRARAGQVRLTLCGLGQPTKILALRVGPGSARYPISDASWEPEHVFSDDGNMLTRYKTRHNLL